MQKTPQTLEQIKGLKVTADNEWKLEYFFYTNTDVMLDPNGHREVKIQILFDNET